MDAKSVKEVLDYLSLRIGDRFVVLFDDNEDIGMISAYELEELKEVFGQVLDTLHNGDVVRKNISNQKGKVRKLDC